MDKLIDLHSHLLPGVDDGIQTMEDAIEASKLYVEMGYEVVVCTPHYLAGTFTSTVDENWGVLTELQEALNEKKIPLQLVLGNEFYLDSAIAKYLEMETGYSLNGGRYVLIEFPMVSFQPDTEAILGEVLSAGYIPIIAHPERYQYVQENPAWLIPLIAKGMRVQMNLSSFDGLFGSAAKECAQVLLSSGLVHLIGTDTHSTGRRSPRVASCIERLGDYLDGKDYQRVVYENPSHILKDESFEVEIPEAIVKKEVSEKKKRWFF